MHPILGYIVAGLILGPFTPGYAASETNLSILAQLGLIFLLFSIGLEFSLAEIRRIGAGPLIASLAAMALVVLGTIGAAALTRFPHAVVLGFVAMLSSTAIGVALLAEARLAGMRAGRVALSILIVQDLLAVLLLVAIEQPASQLSLLGLVRPLIATAVFLVLALTLGATLIKRLVIRTLAQAHEDQRVIVFVAIALCTGLVAHFFGLSLAFGAFVAGAVTATLEDSQTVEHVIAPFKNLFVLCFFVSIGAIIDPALVIANWMLVAIVAIVIVVVRLVAWIAFARVCGIAARAAVVFGIAMVPLGEFNIVLAQAAEKSGQIDATELATCIGVTLVSIVVATVLQPLVAGMSLRRPQEQPA